MHRVGTDGRAANTTNPMSLEQMHPLESSARSREDTLGSDDTLQRRFLPVASQGIARAQFFRITSQQRYSVPANKQIDPAASARRRCVAESWNDQKAYNP